MNSIEELLKARASAPLWFVGCALALPLVLAVMGIYLLFELQMFELANQLTVPSPIGDTNAIRRYDSVWDVPPESLVLLFGILACSFCFIISVFVLVYSLPIYLKSENPEISDKAGGLVKTCLYFITGSASGILLAIGLG
jgi:hypothetical protein